MAVPTAAKPDAPLPDEATLGELLEADVELVGRYHECSGRHRALADWLN